MHCSRMRLGRPCVTVKMPLATPMALLPPSKRARSNWLPSPPSAAVPSRRSTAMLKSNTSGGSTAPSKGLAAALAASVLGGSKTSPSATVSGSPHTSMVRKSERKYSTMSGVTTGKSRSSRKSKVGADVLAWHTSVWRSSMSSVYLQKTWLFWSSGRPRACWMRSTRLSGCPASEGSSSGGAGVTKSSSVGCSAQSTSPCGRPRGSSTVSQCCARSLCVSGLSAK
mmetsp:Transcript_19322/g.56969  ORF Transcript_19322/g.56969 Transcript_19322/m.56969 type:complete len:225 (-) Transcript_19322:711-1385(-)